MRRLLPQTALILATLATPANAETHVHAEVDPLPFALGGYGLQVGIAHETLPGFRLGLGNFSLEVPDFAVQRKSANDGFHLRIRRSHALYGLYFFDKLRGWCAGASLRYLRTAYSHDEVPGQSTRVTEISTELIGGYKWHPTRHGFYVMPWLALAIPIAESRAPRVGTHTYEADPVSLFATANLGWEF